MRPFILAVDPGVKGGFAWQIPGEVPHCEPFKDAGDLVQLCAQFRELPFSGIDLRVAYLEEVSGFIGVPRPGRAMFTFGRSFGRIEAWCAMANFEIRRVRPQQWQKALGCLSHKGESCADHKRRLVALARERFPALDVRNETADALLILDYGLEG
jgi:hypothetical protein